MIQLKTLGQLAELVKGSVIGDANTVIDGVGSILGADPGSITFIEDGKWLEKAENTRASAVIAPGEVTLSTKPLLIVDHPKLAFAQICSIFVQKPLVTGQIHPMSSISGSARLGENISVHPFAVIADNAVIGDHCIIGPGVYVGQGVRMGNHCEIHANAVLEYHTVIGNNVIIHGGTIIGTDGFGFVTTRECHHKVPQLGNVIIGDDVEIFANVTIDRGTVGPTVIGAGTKIGADAHVGHNVKVGPQCILIAKMVIGGSAVLGRRVMAGGKSGIREHVSIGDNVKLAAGSIAMGDIKEDSFCSGHPAMDINKDYRIKAAARKLPQLLKQVAQLEKRLAQLEETLGECQKTIK